MHALVMHAPSTQLGRRHRGDFGPLRGLAHQQVQIPPLSILQHYANVLFAGLFQSRSLIRSHVAKEPLHCSPIPGADHHIRSPKALLTGSPRHRITRRCNLQHARNLGEERILLPPCGIARSHLAPFIWMLSASQPDRSLCGDPRHRHAPSSRCGEPYRLRHLPPLAHEKLPRTGLPLLG
jgi:hypothetical protein